MSRHSMHNIKTKEQLIKQLSEYIESAPDWDLCEIFEWVFGYDDPMVEKFREEIQIQEKKANQEETSNAIPLT